jgi:hypothetical protein
MAVENFDSLRDTLQEALQKKFGKDHYLDEFSHSHVIFSKPGEKNQRRAPYTITNTGGASIGKHEPVRRVSGYERVHKAAKEALQKSKPVTAGTEGKGYLQD